MKGKNQLPAYLPQCSVADLFITLLLLTSYINTCGKLGRGMQVVTDICAQDLRPES
jgi:hypothetical protein